MITVDGDSREPLLSSGDRVPWVDSVDTDSYKYRERNAPRDLHNL